MEGKISGAARSSSLLAIVVMIAQIWFAPAEAQEVSWPLRPITLIVPFAAGGPADVIARVRCSGSFRKARQAGDR